MAITSADQLLAGMQPANDFFKATTPSLTAARAQSLIYLAGLPGAAVAPTSAITGDALTSYPGQHLFANPVSGTAYLARLQAQSVAASGTLLLCDRLWHNASMSITSNTAQTINSVTWPARDANGATDGVGVFIGVEVSTITGSGTPTLTLGYTNSGNTAGRTATNIFTPTAASSPVGTFYQIGLQGADLGVRSIQNFTLSATWTSGVIHLVAYRVLARLDLGVTPINAIDSLVGGMPKAYNNTVPFLLFIPQTSATTTISGHIIWTHG